MKWLLVTTNPTPFAPASAHPHGAGWNVGDQFARIGTEQLVREVDPDAEIGIVNMDVASSITDERTFDRAIFAGRPMFWHDAESSPLWVHLLNGWLCRDSRKVMALGVGDCFPLHASRHEEETQAAAARARCWRVLLRHPCSVGATVCPGAWAIADRPEQPAEKLCNLMLGGTHYPAFDECEAARWRSIVGVTSAILRAEGFAFVAHTFQESELAASLGWRGTEIRVASCAEDYLRIYAGARNYIGNRMHGAIVLAGRPAVATAIGFDSRLRAVEHAGAYVIRPSGLGVTALLALARLQPGAAETKRIERIRAERGRMRTLIKEFAS